MNAREQYLKMRCDRLEAELKVALHVLDRALADLEFTESVGAAFAFEVGASIKHALRVYNSEDSAHNAVEGVELDARDAWDDAVKALEQQNVAERLTK